MRGIGVWEMKDRNVVESVWRGSAERMSFPALSGDADTDVLVIGGGMAGILTAYMLRERGVECMLVEADRICRGTTGNTTAKITIAHGLIYDKLIRRFGVHRAALYLEAEREGCRMYEELCRDIPADYEHRDSYVYSMLDPRRIMREVKALSRLGADAEFVRETALPFEVAGAVRVSGEAQFNPLKFAFGIAEGLPIYERTKVRELMPGEAVCSGGKIKYKRAVVATHFPILNKHGAYFVKMYQHRSYVIALEGAGRIGGMYVDESDKGLSFRDYGELLLLGGGGHRTGKRGGCWQELERFAREHYKDARIKARWAAQDCMTLDGIPYIGRYSASTDGLYVATGFNKWGMSSSMVAAMLLSDILTGKESKYEEVFSPSRSILRPQLAINAAESALGLITPTAPRCPHLGCALKYNREEHSWDCPCHGSRFGEEGELLEGPATDDKTF